MTLDCYGLGFVRSGIVVEHFCVVISVGLTILINRDWIRGRGCIESGFIDMALLVLW